MQRQLIYKVANLNLFYLTERSFPFVLDITWDLQHFAKGTVQHTKVFGLKIIAFWYNSFQYKRFKVRSVAI